MKRLLFSVPELFFYQGWMNEIFNYDPETYHATLTHSVYVRVEGSTIRLSKPNHNIARRAAHNDSKPDVTFVSQKIYDLANSKVGFNIFTRASHTQKWIWFLCQFDCIGLQKSWSASEGFQTTQRSLVSVFCLPQICFQVYLVPPGLARKRVWNKKYPICIELSRQDDFMSKAEGDRSEPSDGVSTSETGEANHGASSPSSKDLTLFLFGRTGRDKEEWFQRFLSASNPKVDTRKASRVGNGKETWIKLCK